MSDDNVPESIELFTEHYRRVAAELSDYRLDEALAITIARRDVAAAHGRYISAQNWNKIAVAYAEVRDARTKAMREIDDMTGPQAITRPLTDDELEDIDEPPC